MPTPAPTYVSTPVRAQVSSLPVATSGASGLFTLAVLGDGVRMPAIPVAETKAPPAVVTQPAPPAPAVVEQPAPKPVPYVPPFHPRKQDRN